MIQSRRGKQELSGKRTGFGQTLESVSTKEAIPNRENLSGKIQRQDFSPASVFNRREYLWN